LPPHQLRSQNLAQELVSVGRRPRGNGIGSLNGRFQPLAALRANVVFPFTENLN
jgi:hypothetical protein